MRSFLVVTCALCSLAAPTRADEGAPNPLPIPIEPREPAPEEEPAPPPEDEPAPEGDAPPPPVPIPDEGDDEEPEGEAPKKLPPPDEGSSSNVPMSTGGCVILGCLPAIGVGIGAASLATVVSGALAQTGAESVCFAIVGIGGGVFIGAPSALLLGPCSSGGALIGGLVGAASNDKQLGPSLVGSLPGLGLGALSSAGTAWGLIVLANTSGDFVLPATILGLSALAGFAAGPVTIAGMAIADGVSEPLPRSPRPSDDVPSEVPVVTTRAVMAF